MALEEEFRTEPMVAAGDFHTVALRTDGTVWTWGWNGRGQLGTDATPTSHRPTQVQALTNVIAISAGRSHTVALRSDGTVWAWGCNEYGQLGDGTTGGEGETRFTPVQVQALTDVTAISAGGSHTVALQNDGTVWTLGRNEHGQLGDGTTINRYAPVRVHILTNVTAVSAGSWDTVALRNDGAVWAWGSSMADQLGNGTTTDQHTPMQVQALTNMVAVSVDGWRTVALRSDGTVWTWGSYDITPIQVQSLTNVIAVSAGFLHIATLRDDGTIWAWGNGMHGQLGNNDVDVGLGGVVYSATPVQTEILTNVIAVSAGMYHTVALQDDGTVWAWGENFSGQLGHSGRSQWTPIRVPGLNLTQGRTPFTDVPWGAWFHDAIAFVHDHNLMQGTTPILFAPNATLTRAMAVTILYRMAGEPAVTDRQVFGDVAANRWYSDAVLWAFDAGLITGITPDTFAPGTNITREQFATMLHRYAQYMGQDTSVPPDFALGQFTDYGNMSDWAQEAMRWSVYTGLITGTTPTTLSPQDTVTRAQCATILMRYMQVR